MSGAFLAEPCTDMATDPAHVLRLEPESLRYGSRIIVEP